MTLETLLDRASINRYQRYTWFSHCRFDGKNLVCWDKDDHWCIERCFLPQLRQVLPMLVLNLVGAPVEQKPVKPKSSLWKKGYEPTPQNLL